MNEESNYNNLVFEERKAIKLLLWLFYIFFITFDLFWYVILPKYSDQKIIPIPGDGLGYWVFVLIASLLPISIILLKKNNPYIVKYFFLIGYLLIDFIDNSVRYYGTSESFAAGNIVEVLFVFYSPVFVNKKFFWTVVLGIIGKYLFLGLVLQDIHVLTPIMIYTILSGCAFILLSRFFSYINSLTSVYKELGKKEKLAAIGQMAATVGHEIRNPLSSLKGFTQLQKEKYPNTNDYYPIMIQEIDRINSILNDLLYLGKPRVLQIAKASIEDIISYTISITQHQAESQNIKFETNLEIPLPLLDCDEKQLKQVFINLIKNAIEAMPDGGRIRINVQSYENREIYISVEDEGCGIAEDKVHNLVEPFYTTKKDGTGLGLMVSNQIIKDHKGQMNFKNNLGKGTIVEVIFPLSQNVNG